LKAKEKITSIILHATFGMMLLAVLVFFVMGEIIMPTEDPTGRGNCTLYEGEWDRVLPDGTKEKIEVPGQYKADRKEPVRIETVLSQNQGDMWFCMRASQQDMRVYVGEELIKEYTTEGSRLFGRNSASAYVFFRVTDEDAGKRLAIEIVSDSEYSGFLNKVYVGEKNDIVNALIRQCFGVIFCSLYMLVLSSLVVIVGFILRLVYKKSMDITFLGTGILILSISMTVESNVRQFFLSNVSIASHVGFLLTILLPYPFMQYINRLQKNRYERLYKSLATAVMLNFILSVILQLTGVVDLLDSTAVSYALIILMVIFFGITICMDIKKKRINEYGEVVVGIGFMILVSLWETCVTFIPVIPVDGGIALSFGLMVLLLTAVSKTARELMAIEKEKQIAIASSRAKAQFLANMSHEIRTPINTIIGMNEMILRENSEETVQEYAHNVKNASKILLGLVNDVLDFSKIESGKMEIINAEYQLSKLLTDVINGIRVKAEKKNLEFITDIDPSMPSVLLGDELRICQILNNLLSNAVKYTENGSISLFVRGIRDKDGFILHMSVEDTGTGIKPENMDKLFESFKRLEIEKNRFIEGTGLGLNISKQLTELMGGDIGVTSEYGKGSCFTVNIPQQIVRDIPLGKLDEAYRRDIVDKKEDRFKLYAPTAEILVVDDNKMNLSVVSALLKRTAIKLTLAGSGTECLELCKKNRYDIILMDHMMPDPDGIETLHMLRKDRNSKNRSTEVIVLTANAIAGMSKMYLEEGFSDYLSKPVVAEELEKIIAKYLPANKLNIIEEEDKDTGVLHIDKKIGMDYCGNDAGIYEEMISEYIDQGAEYEVKLMNYYKERDWKNYRTVIHALKNTSLLIGAVAFAEKAKNLERASGEAKEEILLKEHEGFHKEYRKLLDKLQKIKE